MPPYSENALQGALNAVYSGDSVIHAAADYAVPKTTLLSRLQGRESYKTAHASRQRLSTAQEDHMVNWIRIQAALALPPSYAQIRALAACVLQAGGDATPLGRRWLDAFFKRNPTCKTMPSKRMDTARLNGATVEVIQPWFRHLAVPEINRIHQIDRYNMDETGIMEGLSSNGLVVGIAEMRTALKKDDGRRNWTTIIECISATGWYLPPLVIWKGINVQQQWFPTEGLKGFKE